MSDETPKTLSTQETVPASADRLLANDPTTQALGIRVAEVRPGYARLDMTVRPDMLNGHGTCHGGMIFTLADSAFAYASNAHNALSVAQSCDIEFVDPAREGELLVAVCAERHRRGRTGIYDVSVTAGEGRAIAFFHGRSRTVGGPLVEQTN